MKKSRSELKMQIARKYLLFAVSIASLSQRCLSHNCSTPLRNKVAYEGTSASFEREFNDEIVMWTILQYSLSLAPFPLPAEKLTNDDGSIAEQFVNTYAVNHSQLTIFNSTIAPQGSVPYPTAGMYQYAYEYADCMTSACLVVVRSGPVCTSNPDTMSCQVDFVGCEYMQINPIMTWKDKCGTIIKSETPSPSSQAVEVPGLQRSISTLTVTDSHPEVYECQLTFSKPPSSIFSGFAMDPPDFSATCRITRPSTTTTASNCSGENLENTVVYEGNTTTTFPRLNNGQWQVIPASSFYNAIMDITDSDGGDDDYLNVEFSSTYELSPSNLKILNSTLAPQERMPQSTAGLYFLKRLNPNCTMAANLIVIRSGPVCAYNATNPNSVTLACSVIFAQSSKQPNNPVFTWKKSDGVQVKQDQPIPRQIDRYTKKSMSQLSIASNVTTTYECQMTFSRTPKAPLAYINMNAPRFMASCSVSRV